MKNKLLALLLLLPAMLFAQDLKFEKPVKVMANGEPINVREDMSGCAAPVYYDIDKDGAKDLLVGQYDNGSLRIYHNYGTTEAPEFKDFKYFSPNGAKAAIPPS